MIVRGWYNMEKKNIPRVLYSIFDPKFTGRGFPVLLTYRNYSKKPEIRVRVDFIGVFSSALHYNRMPVHLQRNAFPGLSFKGGHASHN